MLKRRGLLAGLFAPVVITTPGLLMPVSTLAFPTYGPNGGLLTHSMIAREFNRRLQAMVRAGFVPGGSPLQQSNVDMEISTMQLTLSMEMFSKRYIEPAASIIARQISENGGNLAIGAALPEPPGADYCAFSEKNGVMTRVVSAYDISIDARMLRFDVLHS